MPNSDEIISEWEEPLEDTSFAIPRLWVVLTCIGIAILFALVGFFTKQSNFYFGAAAILATGFVVWSEKHAKPQPRKITISQYGIQINAKYYPVADLLGFWLEQDGEIVIVNLEPRKKSFFPISLLYPDETRNQIRTLLLQVLPEVEPRSKAVGDDVNKIIRL